MSQQESTAIFSATQSELNEPVVYQDEHFQGALSDLETQMRANSSYIEMLHHEGWYRNKDRRYGKIFAVVLKNGSEHYIHSHHTISEKEYFLRKLKHG